MISFSCPSRGRPKYAKRLVDTAQKTANNDVEILFNTNTKIKLYNQEDKYSDRSSRFKNNVKGIRCRITGIT